MWRYYGPIRLILGSFWRSRGIPIQKRNIQYFTVFPRCKLMFAQFDRYCAVCFPFYYERFVSRSLVTCVRTAGSTLAFLFLFVANLIPATLANKLFGFSVATLQIVVLTNVVKMIKLFFVAKHQVAGDSCWEEQQGRVFKDYNQRCHAHSKFAPSDFWAKWVLNVLVKTLF